MVVGDIKLKWSKDKDDWWGTILPMFLIYKSGKQMYLDVMEPDRKEGCENRHLVIDSVHQGKCIAAEMLKIAREATPKKAAKRTNRKR